MYIFARHSLLPSMHYAVVKVGSAKTYHIPPYEYFAQDHTVPPSLHQPARRNPHFQFNIVRSYFAYTVFLLTSRAVTFYSIIFSGPPHLDKSIAGGAKLST